MGPDLQLTVIRNPGVPFNGHHPRNLCNYMDNYSFTNHGGKEGWVGLVGWPIADTLPTKWSHVNHRSGYRDWYCQHLWKWRNINVLFTGAVDDFADDIWLQLWHCRWRHVLAVRAHDGCDQQSHAIITAHTQTGMWQWQPKLVQMAQQHRLLWISLDM